MTTGAARPPTHLSFLWPHMPGVLAPAGARCLGTAQMGQSRDRPGRTHPHGKPGHPTWRSR
eukprot:10195227-Lingulodinium_polyedra.AAC.1